MRKRRLRFVQERSYTKGGELFHTLKRQYKAKAQTGEITCLILYKICLSRIFPQIRCFSHGSCGITYLGFITWVQMRYQFALTMKVNSRKVQPMQLPCYFIFYKRDTSRTLVLFSDGCSCQNKNYVMLHFLYILVHCFKMFDSITSYFPIRGHSYL